ncbi:MAG: nitrogenase [Sarcina sp.]|nr:nitrogenase [Sarcina sp.]
MLQRILPQEQDRREDCPAGLTSGKRGCASAEDVGAAVRIRDASFPEPFARGLEFNAPVHGAWNIVHVGMQVPECHQIYVCADNCMRGVVLTAAEMDAADRFSCVLLEEEDLYEGSLETVTIEGVADAIRRLPYRPRAVAVFLVCLHHFVGTDAAYVYSSLEKQFPDIDFMRCWMDPVMRRSGLSPEQKLKESMFRPIRPLPPERRIVCDLGDNQPLDPESELSLAIREAGFTLLQLQDCRTYDDYLRMGAADLFITRSPSGIHGVTQLAKRLGRPFLYLPPACGEEEINAELAALREVLAGIRPECARSGNMQSGSGQAGSIQLEDGKELFRRSREALARVLSLIGDTEVTIDHFATPRLLSLARLLLESGFHVTRVYLDVVAQEEKDDFDWLRDRFPDLILNATVHPGMRVLHKRENEGHMLAIGPKAAWFGGTAHFVNLVECGGLWGFTGIEKLAAQMEDAFLHEKDTRKLVPRKGFGCTCVL